MNDRTTFHGYYDTSKASAAAAQVTQQQLAAQEALHHEAQRHYLILVSHDGPVQYSLWRKNHWGGMVCVAMHRTLEEARELRRVKLVEERLAGEPEPELRWTEQPSQPIYPQQPGGMGVLY